MKLTYGTVEFKIGALFLIGALLLLITDQILLDLIFGEITEDSPAPLEPEKILLPLSLLGSFFFYNRLSSSLKNFFVATTLYLILMIGESYFFYGKLFVYQHVFSKLIALYVVFFIYLFFQNVEEKDFSKVIVLICIVFVLDLIIFKRDVFSLGSFLSTERGISASSAYLLLLIALYYFNTYFLHRRMLDLFIFLIVLGLILFFQHRSVWIATVFSLFLNIILFSKANFKTYFRSFASVTLIPFCIVSFALVFILVDSPEFLEKLTERTNDIANYQTEGTGSWRYQQFQSYWPFIEDNLFLGMKFKGFELPIQFFHPDAGTPLFNDGTGHHFHSLYLDKLFYLGLAGTLIFVLMVLYLCYLAFQRKKLSVIQITLLAFTVSGLIYGISYNWPTYFYGIIGIAIAFLEREIKLEEDTEENQEADTQTV